MEEFNKERLVTLLAGALPGTRAQSRMAPRARIETMHDERCRDAAVMLLLYPDQQDVRMVFIKRNEYEGPHSGQISFPGGMKESYDHDLEWTALRETNEETGVKLTRNNIIGPLTSLYIPVSNFCVHPYVGWMDGVPDFQPDQTEVQYLVCPAIADLFDPANLKTGTFDRHGVDISTPYFDAEGEMIWGATAMMLSEFKALIGY